MSFNTHLLCFVQSDIKVETKTQHLEHSIIPLFKLSVHVIFQPKGRVFTHGLLQRLWVNNITQQMPLFYSAEAPPTRPPLRRVI